MRTLSLIAVAALCALAGCGGGGGKQATTTTSGKTVAVPKLRGVRLDQAKTLLAKRGLRLVRHVVASKQPAGIVIGQQPRPGTRVARKSAVALNVSRGPKLVAIPALTGLTRTDAEARLAAVKLFASVKIVHSSKPAGTVVAQTPPPGARVVPNSGVAIDVSG